MLTRHSAFALLLLAFTSASATAAPPDRDSATLESIESKLDVIIRRIEALEQRISRLEVKVARRPALQFLGTVGPYLIDKHGFLYDQSGRQIGIWGVNGETQERPAVRRR